MRKPYGFFFASVAFAILATCNVSAHAEEPAYERVARTGTLRCAYMLWPSFMVRDPNTGKFSGYNYEMMEAVAASLNLKVEWVSEIAPGSQVEALKAHKADAICSAEGPLATTATVYLAYTEPLAYFPFFAYVRTDDKRFEGKIDRINAEDVRIDTIDGDASSEAARTLFPKAKQLPLPQMADPSQMMLDVMSGKSDVVINDDFSMSVFMHNNPGKLRKISSEVLMVVPNTFSTLRTDLELADMLSQGIRNVRDRRIEEKIFNKYGIGRDIPLYLVAPRYVVPK